MTTMLWLLVLLCCSEFFGAVTSASQNSENNSEANSDRGPQLFYVPQQNAQPQRPEGSNSDARYFQFGPMKQVSDIQSIGGDRQTRPGAASKLETLEPDAELIPGAQQPQGPASQIPISPSGIPGLLPGQQVYIVHPQHQIYMNALYPGIPNGYGPNVQQVPGYQRVYIIQAQPTLGDGSFAAPAGYQTSILIDPSTGQQLMQPQYQYPTFQQFTQPPNKAANVQQAESKESQRNTLEPLSSQIKNGEPTRNFAEQFRRFPETPAANKIFSEQLQNNPGIRSNEEQQKAFDPSVIYGGFQPQSGPGLQGTPGGFQPHYGPGLQGAPGGFPFYPFNIIGDNSYLGPRSEVQLTSNPLPFTRLGQLQGLFAGMVSVEDEQAQGRNDINIEETKDVETTESKSVIETTKKPEEKVESAPSEPKVTEDSKEAMESENVKSMTEADDMNKRLK